ncbi:MAG: hypothetical protein L3J87_03680, partial [Thermoplasmata archaeon]|nr:hypothetical protein [Thermoplasmata archaeon]
PLPAAKIGGVLVDAPALPDGKSVVVVGVGLNANTPTGPTPPELRRRGAVVAERTGRTIDLVALEGAVDASLRTTVKGLADEEGRLRALARCRERLFGVGQRVAVDGRVGGRLEGLADDGALLVREKAGLREVRVGDLLVLGD